MHHRAGHQHPRGPGQQRDPRDALAQRVRADLRTPGRLFGRRYAGEVFPEGRGPIGGRPMIFHFMKRDFISHRLPWAILVLFTMASLLLFRSSHLIYMALLYAYLLFAITP